MGYNIDESEVDSVISESKGNLQNCVYNGGELETLADDFLRACGIEEGVNPEYEDGYATIHGGLETIVNELLSQADDKIEDYLNQKINQMLTVNRLDNNPN